MIKGTTKSGFAYSVDPEVVRDMEFVELAAAARKDGLLLPEIITMVLGDKQKKKLYDHIKKEHKRVLVDYVNDDFTEILESINTNDKTKN